jgi:hypothetical protein
MKSVSLPPEKAVELALVQAMVAVAAVAEEEPCWLVVLEQ